MRRLRLVGTDERPAPGTQVAKSPTLAQRTWVDRQHQAQKARNPRKAAEREVRDIHTAINAVIARLQRLGLPNGTDTPVVTGYVVVTTESKEQYDHQLTKSVCLWPLINQRYVKFMGADGILYGIRCSVKYRDESGKRWLERYALTDEDLVNGLLRNPPRFEADDLCRVIEWLDHP